MKERCEGELLGRGDVVVGTYMGVFSRYIVKQAEKLFDTIPSKQRPSDGF